MSYSTPPSTVRKGIFTRTRQPEYYEDLYGERNAEEAFDRHPDICESESDSEDEDTKSFSKYKLYRRLPGENGKKANEVSQFEDTKGDKPKYKIAPRLNSRRSVAVPAPKKKLLTPKKFGLFGASFQKGAQDDSDSNEEDVPRTKEKTVALEPIVIDDSDDETSEYEEEDEAPAPILFSDVPVRPETTRVKQGRIKRPEHRQLISQQLAEQAKAKKLAKRKAHADEVHLKKQMKRFKKGEAVVIIDNSNVDMGSFVRDDEDD